MSLSRQIAPRQVMPQLILAFFFDKIDHMSNNPRYAMREMCVLTQRDDGSLSTTACTRHAILLIHKTRKAVGDHIIGPGTKSSRSLFTHVKMRLFWGLIGIIVVRPTHFRPRPCRAVSFVPRFSALEFIRRRIFQ